MATVNIGGRDLDVKPATLGFLKRKVIPWQATMATAEGEAAIDQVVTGFLLYLLPADGVDADWLLANLPAESAELFKAVVAASK